MSCSHCTSCIIANVSHVVSDVYVCAVSYTHFVASKPYFIAIVSTTVETEKPEREIQVGLDLLGPISEK